MQLKDIKVLLRLVLLSPLAWFVPPRYWEPLRMWLARLRGAVTQKPLTRRVQLIGDNFPEACSQSDLSYHVDYSDYEESMQFLHLLLWKNWQPQLTVIGLEKLRASLADGYGAILWVGQFAGVSFMQKKALFGAGLEVHHLSRLNHGFGSSPFMQTYLNPAWRQVEDCYLGERILIEEGRGGTIASLRAMKRRLKENKIVSISDWSMAVQTVRRPFLFGSRTFTAGPGKIAVSAKAPLFPVMTRRLTAVNFEIIIEDPIYTPSMGDNSIDAVIDRYSEVLGRYVCQSPCLWKGWGDNNLSGFTKNKHT